MPQVPIAQSNSPIGWREDYLPPEAISSLVHVTCSLAYDPCSGCEQATERHAGSCLRSEASQTGRAHSSQ